MLISVVIPTCNRYDLLRICLNNLLPSYQTIESLDYEIIVSDDTKENNQLDILQKEYKTVRFLSGPKKGPASNRNFGAKQATGDWIVFIDDDCIPDKELLKSYYQEIIKGEYKGFEGRIEADRDQKRFDEESPINTEGGCFWSCNIAVEKNIFDKVNGFDEAFPFPALEDTDFYMRLKSVTETSFVEKAKVIHPWRRMTAFTTYKKRIFSHQYMLKKTKTDKDLKYRLIRIKIFFGALLSNTKSLIGYSFKGIGFYTELNWFNFLMIFK